MNMIDALRAERTRRAQQGGLNKEEAQAGLEVVKQKLEWAEQAVEGFKNYKSVLEKYLYVIDRIEQELAANGDYPDFLDANRQYLEGELEVIRDNGLEYAEVWMSEK